MTILISNNVWNILTCSYCGSSLIQTNGAAECSHCHLTYEFSKTGSLDLRLKRSKEYHLDIKLGNSLLPENGFQFDVLQNNPNPEVDFSSNEHGLHLSRELLSYFPKAQSNDSLMLDIGCGKASHKRMCEHAGFEWVGLDYDSPKAPIIGDAHALPFKNNSFEFLLSLAVLEHIRYPSVMMREAFRVLKPHGKFIGTVAFLEPFHGDSYYHHTHLGTYNTLKTAGFLIDKIAPNDKWPVLYAQQSALFPKMPGLLSHALIFPLQQLHKLWWITGNLVSKKANDRTRILHTTGSFAFVASKEI
jgi:SAM-dependent methyltransferase